MTNPTPEKMLELAKICEPDKEWEIRKGVVYLNVAPREAHLAMMRKIARFDPLNNDAQLMQVVFALWKKIGEGAVDNFKQAEIEIALEEQDKQTILNLAVEVLL